MAAYQKFYQFVADMANGVHDFATASVKVMLTNTAPVATDTVVANITEITAGNGYTAGGNVCTLTSSTQSGGVYKLVLASPAAWTASGGSIGPFRYAVIYNSSTASGNLMGFWDYGVSNTLLAGDLFSVTLDTVNGVLQLE